jgi:hypothetical protein
MPEPAGESPIIGVRRPPMTRKTYRAVVLMGLAIVVLFVWDMMRGRWSGLIIAPVFAAPALLQALRPPTVIDAEGIRRPWRRPRMISWPEVASVLAPQLGLDWTRIRLTNGRTIDLTDVPPDRSAAVATLGGQSVVVEQQARRPALPAAPRTDREIEADVQRRAQALAAERQEMETRSRRIRPAG